MYQNLTRGAFSVSASASGLTAHDGGALRDFEVPLFGTEAVALAMSLRNPYQVDWSRYDDLLLTTTPTVLAVEPGKVAIGVPHRGSVVRFVISAADARLLADDLMNLFAPSLV